MRKIVIILALLLSFSSECFADEVYNSSTDGKWSSYIVENKLGKTCAEIYSEALNFSDGFIYTILKMYKDEKYSWELLIKYESDKKIDDKEEIFSFRVDNKKVRNLKLMKSYDGKIVRFMIMCDGLDQEIFEEMKAGEYLRIKMDDDIILKFSLSGFKDSYERCCILRNNVNTFDGYHNRKSDKDYF